MKTDYLNINEMTRTGEKIKKVENIILHSIGNMYSTLEICKKEMDNLMNQSNVYFSLHYVIDKEGNILNCIPEEEISKYKKITLYDEILLNPDINKVE